MATDLAAADAAFGAEVDDVIGGFDHVEIMFDNDQACAVIDQCSEGGEQFVDVVKMQAGRRFVEDEKRFRLCLLREDARRVLHAGLRRRESVVADWPSRR